MRRRLLLLASFTGTLFACASVLGDFDVEPAGSNPDASTLTDASSSSSGSGEGGTTDSGTDAGPTAQPIRSAGRGLDERDVRHRPVSEPETGDLLLGRREREVPEPHRRSAGRRPALRRLRSAAPPDRRRPSTSPSALRRARARGRVVRRSRERLADDGDVDVGPERERRVRGRRPTSTAPFALKSGATLLQFELDLRGADARLPCRVGSLLGNNSNCELRAGTDFCVLQRGGARPRREELAGGGGRRQLRVGVGKTILRMAGGLDHSCTQVRAAGTGADTMDDVLCWGTNVSGQVDSTSPP